MLNSLFSKVMGLVLVAGIGLGSIFWTGTADLQGMKAAADSMVGKIFNLEQSRNNLTDMLNSLKGSASDKINTANGIIADRESTISDLQGQIDSLQEQLANLGGDNSDNVDSINQLTAEVDRLRGEVQKANNEAAQARVYIDSLLAQVADLGNTVVTDIDISLPDVVTGGQAPTGDTGGQQPTEPEQPTVIVQYEGFSMIFGQTSGEDFKNILKAHEDTIKQEVENNGGGTLIKVTAQSNTIINVYVYGTTAPNGTHLTALENYVYQNIGGGGGTGTAKISFYLYQTTEQHSQSGQAA